MDNLAGSLSVLLPLYRSPRNPKALVEERPTRPSLVVVPLHDDNTLIDCEGMTGFQYEIQQRQ